MAVIQQDLAPLTRLSPPAVDLRRRRGFIPAEGTDAPARKGKTTMKKVLMTAIAALALTGTAWAQASADTDADGAISFEEMQAVNPEITAEQFAALDADGDGNLSAEEIEAAQQAGLIAGGSADAGVDAGIGADTGAPAE